MNGASDVSGDAADGHHAHPESVSAYISEHSARLRAEEAERIAETASRAKGEFLAVMSHEFRTPLNAMIGYTQLLDIELAGPLTGQQRDYIRRLSASTEHLLGLVNDVLDLSKMEAGRTQVARNEALTGVATRAALDLVEPAAAAGGVHLVNARREGVLYVGDEHRVRQILVNLLSNAVKFTPTGGTVTVRCGVTDEEPQALQLQLPGPWSYIRVEDTGSGIPPEEQSRIFQPFHQVESGHTRKQGGTGLGLAISRQLAQLMGGDLTVQSTPGAGSAFTLWLIHPRQPHDDMPLQSDPDARAEQEIGSAIAPGFNRVGEILAHSAHEILDAYTAGLRSDPSLSVAHEMRTILLEDHAISLISDLAQSLIMLAEDGPNAADLLKDGSAIQRAIADSHGARRYAQRWDEASVRRDHAIFRRELDRGIRERLADPDAETDAALRILATLNDRAEAISMRAWRRCADMDGDRKP